MAHIIVMARSVMALSHVQEGPEPDPNGPRRLEVVKTNLCKYPEPLGVSLEEGRCGMAVVRYGDSPRRYREPTQAEECAPCWMCRLETAEEELVGSLRDSGFSAGVYGRWVRATTGSDLSSAVREPNRVDGIACGRAP